MLEMPFSAPAVLHDETEHVHVLYVLSHFVLEKEANAELRVII